MEKTSIQIYKKTLPRINILRHQLRDKALSQPELIDYLLTKYYENETYKI
jgi:hypothetical protein